MIKEQTNKTGEKKIILFSKQQIINVGCIQRASPKGTAASSTIKNIK